MCTKSCEITGGRATWFYERHCLNTWWINLVIGQLSIISIINDQWSIINDQLSIIKYQISIINFQLSSNNYQLSNGLLLEPSPGSPWHANYQQTILVLEHFYLSWNLGGDAGDDDPGGRCGGEEESRGEGGERGCLWTTGGDTARSSSSLLVRWGEFSCWGELSSSLVSCLGEFPSLVSGLGELCWGGSDTTSKLFSSTQPGLRWHLCKIWHSLCNVSKKNILQFIPSSIQNSELSWEF